MHDSVTGRQFRLEELEQAELGEDFPKVWGYAEAETLLELVKYRIVSVAKAKDAVRQNETLRHEAFAEGLSSLLTLHALRIQLEQHIEADTFLRSLES